MPSEIRIHTASRIAQYGGNVRVAFSQENLHVPDANGFAVRCRPPTFGLSIQTHKYPEREFVLTIPPAEDCIISVAPLMRDQKTYPGPPGCNCRPGQRLFGHGNTNSKRRPINRAGTMVDRVQFHAPVVMTLHTMKFYLTPDIRPHGSS